MASTTFPGNQYASLLGTVTAGGSSGSSITEEALKKLISEKFGNDYRGGLPGNHSEWRIMDDTDKYQATVRLSEKDVMEVIEAALRGTREMSKISILKYYISVVEMTMGLTESLEKKDRKKYEGAKRKLQECVALAQYEIGIAEHPDDYTWRKKDGTVVKLPDMDDSYILNAIRYMKNKAVEKVLLEGKYATMEEAMAHLGKRYAWLNFEAKRRGIIDKVDETDDNGGIGPIDE